MTRLDGGFDRALADLDLRTVTRSPVLDYLHRLLDEYRELEEGQVATYIPELGQADPNWFGICVVTADGHVYEVGDTDLDFTIQSISKPFVFGMALEDQGRDAVLERVGVERRLYTAGNNKSRLDPFLPEKPEDVAWLTDMQGQLHELFKDWVRSRRGAKLGAADAAATELFTGEVWTGARAVELGLVDGLGTLREIVSDRFPDAEPVLVEGRKPLLARLGVGGVSARGGASTLVADLIQAAEVRAAWARFGL